MKSFDTFPYMNDEELPEIPDELPVFSLMENVLLPGEPMPLIASDEAQKIAGDEALNSHRLILVTSSSLTDPARANAMPMATLAQIAMKEDLRDGRERFLAVGMKRILLKRITQTQPYWRAQAQVMEDQLPQNAADLLHFTESNLIEYAEQAAEYKEEVNNDLPDDVLEDLMPGEMPPGALCDLIAMSIALPPADKRAVLEELDVFSRMEKLTFLLRSYLHQKRLGTPPSAHLH